MTAMPAGGLVTGSGETSRRIASAISSIALPTRNADCPNAASGSALPWPKRCSRSAGTEACRTAKKLTSDAAASTSESTRLDSSATDPVPIQAENLATISTTATASEAQVARSRRRCAAVGPPWAPAWAPPWAPAWRGRSWKEASLAPCLAHRERREPDHAAETAAPARTRSAAGVPGSPTRSPAAARRAARHIAGRTSPKRCSSASRLASGRDWSEAQAPIWLSRAGSRNRHRPRPRRPARPCPRCGPAGPATSSESRAPRAGWRTARRPCGFRGWCRTQSRARPRP